jgi:hypothetical protein
MFDRKFRTFPWKRKRVTRQQMRHRARAMAYKEGRVWKRRPTPRQQLGNVAKHLDMSYYALIQRLA